jgi:adenosine deaminase
MSEATPGSDLHAALVADWSLLGFEGDVVDRHNHFFAVFAKFAPVIGKHRFPEGILEPLRLAAANGQTYLELMHDFDSNPVGALAMEQMDAEAPWDEAYLLAARDELVSHPEFSAALETSRVDIAAWARETFELLRCGTALAEPACDVGVQWLLAACRYQPREYVFGQWVFAYELAQVSPTMVGLNIVKPEELQVSLDGYRDEMASLRVLRAHNGADPSRAPVHITLHAGELSSAFLAPEDQDELTYHIREAVEVAGAERIGHGVSVLSETSGDGVADLLSDMHREDVAVEICLTSNALLLDAVGDLHPLAAYRSAGVPVALATDDQALFGTTLTDDFTRAVLEQGLDYFALKELARASIQHSFLPGESLWATPNRYDALATACDGADVEAHPEGPCAELLAASPKAEQAFRLERAFASFERARATR